jgi:N-acetylmuramic acid 6-phosphate etherase
MSTETVDPRFVDIDLWPTVSAVEAMLEGQLAAMAALKSQTSAIAAASEAAAARLKGGGRLMYAGAGTSGRIAVQDGVELSPTYNWPQDRLVFLIAGGPGALTESAEGAEDDADAGRAAILDIGAGEHDVVIGVAASGTTPYTLSALATARLAGSLTIAIANNARAPLLLAAEHALLADTGSELVAGSTRMKAGTAQKAVLNMLSTATMLRCGLVYQGLMVNMRVSNDKLLLRGQAMVRDIAGVDMDLARRSLDAAGLEIKQAILIALGATKENAEKLLGSHGDDLRAAIKTWKSRVGADA